ncbi:MAG: enoyl-CoA hydratase/isomerase family protein [Flavisolibacter sp.]|jgi:enoyl-CoA hydratase
MYQTLVASLENGIYTLTINRADKLNALNKEVMKDLDIAVNEIESNKAIRAAIITGSGQKAFVAGADISEFVGLTANEGIKLARTGQEIFFKIENCSKPVVAAVNGFALGGGCELAMACHFRIASENAKFGQPEVNLGLIPGYGGTQRLVQLIGKGRALEMMLSGSLIDAATALHFGLVNQVVPPEVLLPRTRATLEVIISKAPLALSGCIQAANAVFSSENGYEREMKAFGECCDTEDMKEGTTAFLEKRKANFKGR